MKPRPVSVFEPTVSYASVAQLHPKHFPPLAAPKNRIYDIDARNLAAKNTPNKRLRTEDSDSPNNDKNNTSIESHSTISNEDTSASGGQVYRTPSFINNVQFEEVVTSQTISSEPMIVDVQGPKNTHIDANNATALIAFENTNDNAANISTLPLAASLLMPLKTQNDHIST